MTSNIQYCGARFYKCALQVNPASYAREHGRDHGLTEQKYNDAILANCKVNAIEVVGLADHGSADSSQFLREKLKTGGIVVFPGFEIASSEKIHMVCLYPEDTPENKLNSYLGQVMGASIDSLENERTHPSSRSCEEIAEIVLHKQKGFWYAAHMTGQNGLLRLSGAGDNYKHLWKKNELVVAGQIPGTIEDLEEIKEQDKAKFLDIIRNNNPDYKRERLIAIINAKDASHPGDLDKTSASCFVKMTHPNMDSFRNAFYDPESRIRLNSQLVDTHHARIISISWEGGFFSSEGLAFSKNLNSIIGGHGTGKSTLIESIRYALDISPKTGELEKTYSNLCRNNLVNAKISIRVQSHAQHQKEFTISRRYGEPLEIFDDENTLSNLTVDNILPTIEIYSQNEMLEIAKDKKSQIELLGRFLPDLGDYEQKVSAIRSELQKNRMKLQNALESKDHFESGQNQIQGIREQIKQVENLGLEDKLKNVRLLAKEEQIVEQSNEQIKIAIRWLREFDDLFSLGFIDENELENLPNRLILEDISKELRSIHGVYSTKVSEMNVAVKACKDAIEKKVSDWATAKGKMRDELSNIIAELPDQGGKSGAEIAKQFSELQRRLSALEAQKPSYGKAQTLTRALVNERQQLIGEYSALFFQRSTKMETVIASLNSGALKNKIKIELKKGGIRDELKEFLLGIEGIGKTRVEWVDFADDVFPTTLSKIIKNKDSNALLGKYKSFGLTEGTVKKIIDMPEQKRMELEEVSLEDKVDIYFNVGPEGGKADFRMLNDLSTGQKCLAILNILLLENSDPLIMDQPEDNLDNAFIAGRIVTDLRKYKDNRQFIFATHNANIPVIGDADLIAVLQSQTGSVHIENVGSIDEPKVKTSATKILDGGKDAFNMRKAKYGF